MQQSFGSYLHFIYSIIVITLPLKPRTRFNEIICPFVALFNMRLKTLSLIAALASSAAAAYWMEDIPHRGISPFNPDMSYTVFRNVKDFGAKGDGVADDTNAINAAISSGNRCGGDSPCAGTTITPAVVYFPKGTYLISSSIVSYYYTQMIGNPTSMPVIKAAQHFRANGIGLIEANPYQSTGYLRYGATNTFFRQSKPDHPLKHSLASATWFLTGSVVRNLVLDMRQVPGTVCGIHWPSSQATSIQNVVFRMSYDPSRHHSGIFMEEGSGGMLNDLVFYGGEYGAQVSSLLVFISMHLSSHRRVSLLTSMGLFPTTKQVVRQPAVHGPKLHVLRLPDGHTPDLGLGLDVQVNDDQQLQNRD